MTVSDHPDYSRSTKGAARGSVPPLVNWRARGNDRSMRVAAELRIAVPA
jgi:hypothetical protein